MPANPGFFEHPNTQPGESVRDMAVRLATGVKNQTDLMVRDSLPNADPTTLAVLLNGPVSGIVAGRALTNYDGPQPRHSIQPLSL